MKIIKKVLSWDKKKNIDCFGYGNPHSIDHIYPLSLGGSNSNINRETISLESNQLKGDKTKGKIGDVWRFAVLKLVKDGDVYGKMFIRKKDWPVDEWYEVVPIVVN